MSSPRFTLATIEVRERPVKLRLPFQFGSTTVTHTAEAFARVRLDSPRGRFEGLSAQLMVPRWFDKRAALSNEDTIDELRATLALCMAHGPGLSGTISGLSSALRTAVMDHGPADLPRLAAGFGPALVEMAMIDAACKAYGLGFLEAARRDLFGLAEDAPPDLSPGQLRSALAALRGQTRIAMRHTIGYDAPLKSTDVTSRPDDDLPVSLDEVIARTGTRSFKIKLKGDVGNDLDRLRKLADQLAPLGQYHATLDANEQYDPQGFATLVEEYRADPALAGMRAAVGFFEQPLARDIALAAREAPFDFGVPIVIDESDDSDDSLVQALALGWAGTSVKSCKGVLRALINRVRVSVHAAAGKTVILSAEDLTCQPGLCWQQDTLMAATIGATSIERNGHHFAGGMQGADAAEHAAFLAANPQLYEPGPSGPRLIIRQGFADLTSLGGIGFGTSASPDFGHMAALKNQ